MKPFKNTKRHENVISEQPRFIQNIYGLKYLLSESICPRQTRPDDCFVRLLRYGKNSQQYRQLNPWTDLF